MYFRHKSECYLQLTNQVIETEGYINKPSRSLKMVLSTDPLENWNLVPFSVGPV